MKSHSEIGHGEGRGQVFEDIIDEGVTFVEVADDGAFAAFESEDFLDDLNEDDPVNERNEVARVDAMPESTDHDCIKLGQ